MSYILESIDHICTGEAIYATQQEEKIIFGKSEIYPKNRTCLVAFES